MSLEKIGTITVENIHVDNIVDGLEKLGYILIFESGYTDETTFIIARGGNANDKR